MFEDLDQLDSFFDFDDEPAGRPVALHPHPVPCRKCGTVLQATYAQANEFRCPECGEPVCYTCGCVESDACQAEVSNRDGSGTKVYHCWWATPGACGFCLARAAYELYMEATGRPADDPFYMNLGRTSRGFKGLGYGV
jgi:hypothetical protein